jgi:hypothetical protein
MACNGHERCRLEPPVWFSAKNKNGNISGAISMVELAQCNGIFTSNTVALSAAALADTLVFDVKTSNFTRFAPVGLRFLVTILGGLSTAGSYDPAQAVHFTAIRFQDTNYKLDRNNTLCSAFGTEGDNALRVQELPELFPGGQNLEIDVGYATTGDDTTIYLVSALLYGFASRGGSSAPTGIVA